MTDMNFSNDFPIMNDAEIKNPAVVMNTLHLIKQHLTKCQQGNIAVSAGGIADLLDEVILVAQGKIQPYIEIKQSAKMLGHSIADKIEGAIDE
ncbi:MAG: hypothetical protein Q8S55_12135 [Methylococcaceae bacterium]|nr:hypothetical protein [Methylococcaceae bacterium]